MFTQSPVSYLAAFLTGDHGATRQRGPLVSLPEVGAFLWLVLLLAAPLAVFPKLSLSALEQAYPEPQSHLLVETFCGFTALTVSAMILSICLRRRSLSMLMFGLGFLIMGIFDMLHAWTDPHRDFADFVLYHTLSTFFGSVLILAGTLVRIAGERDHGFSRADLMTFAVGLAVMAGVAWLYRHYIPELFPASGGTFPAQVHIVHYLAGVFYVLAAIAFFRHFRVHRQALALLVASLLIVFAQSAYLFSFSSLWNLTWWVWHGTKLLFYLGTMLIVFVGFLLALRAIENSRHLLARANRSLARSRRTAQVFNQELTIRNRLFQEGMLTRNLDEALDAVSRAIRQLLGFTLSELALHVPEDEVDEFNRRIRRLSARWPVCAQRASSTCNPASCRPVLSIPGLVQCNWRDAGCTSVCLPLSANGEEIGRLRLLARGPGLEPRHADVVRALVVEVSAIVHDKLLYQQRQDANDFRTALLRVSTMLTSTLDLDRVLHAVCKESAGLFESDAALVWLPDDETREQYSLAAGWFSETDQQVSAELKAWCGDRDQCAALLRGIGGHYLPLGILWRDDSMPTPFGKPAGCPWEALALFPLLDGNDLVGVMVLARKEPVRFSAATLGKGELLAGQVRIAINNARSYARLAEFNRQLRVAEETKLRSERMAVMGQMAASVAHEVRNPLSAINNCLAVLRADVAEPSRAHAALEIIQGEVERLTGLTSNFLSFGKPRTPINKPIVLERTIEKTCALLERHISQEGLPIVVMRQIEPISSLLVFDSDGLETVIWNLLLNATQAIPGPGRIEVALRCYPGCFLLAVSDSGKGIAPGSRARIFEPFYSQRPLGAGLGLAIVQRLVREWGGRIRLRSEVGQGTAFFVRVPARVEETFIGREVA